MKKVLAMMVASTMAIGVFSACSSSSSAEAPAETPATTEEAPATTEEAPAEAEKIAIEELSVAFVPSKDPDEIVTATEPLKEMLQEELSTLGYEIGEVTITVGTSYEAVGEAMSAGTADIGLIPGGTYVLYSDDIDVILTATRAGLNKDSDNAADWNDGLPTEGTDQQAVGYRALLISGTSDKAQELADIVNSGGELTFEDLDSANWSVMSTTSPAGYIYPTIWLQDNYGKTITDLTSAVTSDSYGSAMARLASGQIDLALIYADARRDFADAWTTDYAREATIWEETNVIGVMPSIYNDTVSVSKNSDIMDADLVSAVQEAFINIGNTAEGKEVIAIYAHDGYMKATDADYDNERKAQDIVRSMNG
ncbi:MAG: PhnD/SsuA/transferrin family substrate-binding protein [Bacillota bacterium]